MEEGGERERGRGEESFIDHGHHLSHLPPSPSPSLFLFQCCSTTTSAIWMAATVIEMITGQTW